MSVKITNDIRYHDNTEEIKNFYNKIKGENIEDVLEELGINLSNLIFKTIKETTYETMSVAWANGIFDNEKITFRIEKNMYHGGVDDESDSDVYYDVMEDWVKEIYEPTEENKIFFRQDARKLFKDLNLVVNDDNVYILTIDRSKWEYHLNDCGLLSSTLGKYYFGNRIKTWGEKETSYVYTELMQDILSAECFSLNNFNNKFYFNQDNFNMSNYRIDDIKDRILTFTSYQGVIEDNNQGFILLIDNRNSKIISSINNFHTQIKQGNSLRGDKNNEYNDIIKNICLVWSNALLLS